ncbi:hypothetical protein [Xinfangfangia pollutisoli]|uniref:hypothetical protein n=1 Tax=Xinfangfangia pollutisoli TaxID=2865960 RepID=UPI001CD5D6B6|nr:hypothetical protein [Xinfangfangia pollutisoli]
MAELGSVSAAPPRPELTLPPAEAAALRAAYEAADVVLEYGSGGSTVMAAEAGAKVWAVESDAAWAQMMTAALAGYPAQILHVDIGPTRDWGHPQDDSHARTWPEYCLKVWDLPDFVHPDVVLVDGRFRLGAFLTVAYRITRPVTLFFDDYTPREAYHRAEALARPTGIIGRMARFDLTPTPLTPDRIRAYTRALMQPV